MLPAIIVTGGKNENDLTSVEVIRGDGTTCSLPSLPSPRVEHSQSGLLACGGYTENDRTTCTRLANGEWKTSHNLTEQRRVHTSWTSNIGILLFGGWDSQKTTELLSSTSSTSTSTFQLPYDTTYNIYILHNIYISKSNYIYLKD